MSRMLVAWGLGACLLVGTGCGGRQSRVASDYAVLRAENAKLRAQRREDRRKLRDLENQVALLEAEGWDDPPPVGGEPTTDAAAPPALPVVVRAPKPMAEQEDFIDYEDPSEQVQYVEDGVEIVYVGEAAKDEVVRPKVALHETRSRDLTTPVTSPSRAAHSPPPLPRPEVRVEQRLPVHKGSVPVLPTGPAPAVVPAPRAAADSTRSASLPSDPRALYRHYHDALRAGNHRTAAVGFRQFVKRYPRHDYADNAQYWLGETFYDQKKFAAAAVEFERVITTYPKGNKVPDAMLKLAFCYEKLGDPAKARGYLRRVVSQYPKSNPAKLAAERLTKMAD